MEWNLIFKTISFLGLSILYGTSFANGQISWNYDSANKLSWAMNCDFNENNLNNEPSKGEQCGPKCRATSGCTHFTWTEYNGGTCWKKKNSVSKSNAFSVSLFSVCGILDDQPIGNGVRFNFINNCPYQIWPGIQGRSRSNPGWRLPLNGGWSQNPGETKSISVPKDFEAGRIWARTGCRSVNGGLSCETGDCGNTFTCDGRGGQPPVTLAEFTLNANNQDYYDVSNVDGFNIPLTIEVVTPAFPVNGNPYYWCKNPACRTNINDRCPPELQKKNSAGRVVACFSACMKFNTDQYCCRGAFNRPETCKSSTWAVNYPKIFKDACPDAYSYAYDDLSSTFFCRNTNYNIKFC